MHCSERRSNCTASPHQVALPAGLRFVAWRVDGGALGGCERLDGSVTIQELDTMLHARVKQTWQEVLSLQHNTLQVLHR